jgi:hypothetical protein
MFGPPYLKAKSDLSHIHYYITVHDPVLTDASGTPISEIRTNTFRQIERYLIFFSSMMFIPINKSLSICSQTISSDAICHKDIITSHDSL